MLVIIINNSIRYISKFNNPRSYFILLIVFQLDKATVSRINEHLIFYKLVLANNNIIGFQIKLNKQYRLFFTAINLKIYNSSIFQTFSTFTIIASNALGYQELNILNSIKMLLNLLRLQYINRCIENSSYIYKSSYTERLSIINNLNRYNKQHSTKY